MVEKSGWRVYGQRPSGIAGNRNYKSRVISGDKEWAVKVAKKLRKQGYKNVSVHKIKNIERVRGRKK